MMAEAIALSSQIAITIKNNYTQLENWTKRGYFLETIIILSVPICIWGLVGNGIVFWLLCFRIKRTGVSIYVLNLAIADLTVDIYYIIAFILFLTPLYIDLKFSRIMENIYLLGYNSGIYLLTAIAAERCLSLFFPVWYECHQLNKLSGTVCAILWALSCLVSVVGYIACYPRFLSSYNAGISSCKAATIFEIIVNFLIFLSIMITSALALFIRMQRKAKQTAPTRLDITITVMVVLFLIFSSPIRIVDIIAYWDQTLDAPIPHLLSLLFDSIKSSINPLVYFFIGCWKRPKDTEPIDKFLERVLSDKEHMAKNTNKPKADQKVSWASEMN
ncbi:proto-oncogene Mas-like [Rhineura floridana]|uniref:proto-oncogene Mas-like n=1 Tax=Rhineura floridana TaxID=261503 RepID=UPI002AC881F8|nr:proto-oncogene Mas-like [Rhineura floridana]